MSFVSEDGQKQCQSAELDLTLCLKKTSSHTCSTNHLRLCRLYLNFINHFNFKASDYLQYFARRVFFTTYRKEEHQICEMAMRMKGKMNLLNTAQGALLYIT